jgi:hypothetical protein
MENITLKFLSMQDLMEFKGEAKLTANYSSFFFDTNTFNGHLMDNEIELAITKFQAIPIKSPELNQA